MIKKVKRKESEYNKIIQPLIKDGAGNDSDGDSESKGSGVETDKLIRNTDRSSNDKESVGSNSTDRVVIKGPKSSASKTVQFEEDRFEGHLPYNTDNIFGDSFLNYSQMDFTRIRETNQLSSESD